MVGLQSWSDENVPPHICVIWSDYMNMQGNLLASVMTLKSWCAESIEQERVKSFKSRECWLGGGVIKYWGLFFFLSHWSAYFWPKRKSHEKISSYQKLSISLPVAFWDLSQGDDRSHALHVFPTGCVFVCVCVWEKQIVGHSDTKRQKITWKYPEKIFFYIFNSPIPTPLIGIFTTLLQLIFDNSNSPYHIN